VPVGGMRAQIRSKGATHLIKVADRAKMDAFGADYPRPDGTCIRDYIQSGAPMPMRWPPYGGAADRRQPTAATDSPRSKSSVRSNPSRHRFHLDAVGRRGSGTGRGATIKSAVSGPIFSMTPCSPPSRDGLERLMV